MPAKTCPCPPLAGNWVSTGIWHARAGSENSVMFISDNYDTAYVQRSRLERVAPGFYELVSNLEELGLPGSALTDILRYVTSEPLLVSFAMAATEAVLFGTVASGMMLDATTPDIINTIGHALRKQPSAKSTTDITFS